MFSLKFSSLFCHVKSLFLYFNLLLIIHATIDGYRTAVESVSLKYYNTNDSHVLF